MQITTSRVVAFVTPVFVALSGVVTTALAKVGVSGLSKPELTAVFVAGSTAGLTAASHWLKGNRDWERAEQDFEHGEKSAATWLASQKALDQAVEPVEKQVEKDVVADAGAEAAKLDTAAADAVAKA